MIKIGANKGHGANFLVRQAAILAAAGIVARLLGFLYRIPMTALIGDEGNAIYAVGYNVYNFFLIISAAGLPAAISKLVSEARAKERYDQAHAIFVTAFFLASTVGAVLTAAIFFFAEEITAALGTRDAYLALQTLAPTVFIFAMMATIRGYFQGMSSTVPTALSQLVEQIFNAIFSIVLAHVMWNFALRRGEAELVYGAAGGTAGTTLGAVAGFIVVAGLYFLVRPEILKESRLSRGKAQAKHKDLHDEPRSQIVKNIAITSSTIIAGTAIFSIVNLIDTWMVIDRLGHGGFEEVRARELFGQLTGKFNPITNLPAAISSSLALVLIPSIAASRQLGAKKEMHHKINAAFRAAMLITIPIALGLGVLGPQIVALLFPSHPEGGTFFIVGFPSIIFLAVSQISTGVLQAVGKIHVPIIAALTGAVVKVVVGYFLIAHPAVNIYGAIVGTTLCYLIAAWINCHFLHKFVGVRLDYKSMALKPVIAATAMAMGCFTMYHLIYGFVPGNAFAVIAAVLAGMVIYAVFMVIIRGFNADDIRVLPGGEKLAKALRTKGII